MIPVGPLLGRHSIRTKIFPQESRHRTAAGVGLMKGRIVVIGASLSGIDALCELVSRLPKGFPAPIFIAQHVASHSPGMLPYLLAKAGPLSAVHPKSGDLLEPGVIYVAPPDRHMLIQKGLYTPVTRPEGKLGSTRNRSIVPLGCRQLRFSRCWRGSHRSAQRWYVRLAGHQGPWWIYHRPGAKRGDRSLDAAERHPSYASG